MGRAPPAGAARAGSGRRGLTLAVVVAALTPGTTLSQTAERLYAAGAVRAAADSFAARATAEPDVPAHWYNLGSARYRAADDAGARAAWIAAARLRPRDEVIRGALRLVPPPDQLSAELTAVAPVTPGEAVLLGVVLWAAAWVLVARRRPLWLTLAVLAAASLALAYGLRTAARYREPLALARRANTLLRVAPYSGAESRRAVGEGTVLRVAGSYGPWRLVRRGSERAWVLESEIAPLASGRDEQRGPAPPDSGGRG